MLRLPTITPVEAPWKPKSSADSPRAQPLQVVSWTSHDLEGHHFADPLEAQGLELTQLESVTEALCNRW